MEQTVFAGRSRPKPPMSSYPEPTVAVPGTVLAACVVAGILAVVGLFFPPWGWLWAIGYVVAAVALYRLQVWAYWVLIALSILNWISTAMQGRFDVISTGILIVTLLLTPSARSAFRIGRFASPGPGTDEL